VGVLYILRRYFAEKLEIYIKMNNLRQIPQSLPAVFVRAVSLAALLLLVACTAQKPPQELSPKMKAALLERVTQRWHALEKKDFAATYDYTTPNYRRVFPKALYVNKFSYAVDWELTGVELLNYDARAAVASVAVRVMSKPAKQTSAASNALGAIPLTMHENWLYVDGQWWHGAKD